MKADVDKDGEITVTELVDLMVKAEQELGSAGQDEHVPWRQLARDITFWGLVLFCVGTINWFVSNYLRGFTTVADSRWLQYTTALTWTIGGFAFIRIDLQEFTNAANRASMTYQKVLADARGSNIVLDTEVSAGKSAGTPPSGVLASPPQVGTHPTPRQPEHRKNPLPPVHVLPTRPTAKKDLLPPIPPPGGVNLA